MLRLFCNDVGALPALLGTAPVGILGAGPDPHVGCQASRGSTLLQELSQRLGERIYETCLQPRVVEGTAPLIMVGEEFRGLYLIIGGTCTFEGKQYGAGDTLGMEQVFGCSVAVRVMGSSNLCVGYPPGTPISQRASHGHNHNPTQPQSVRE